jgi:hypothetical protein
MTGSGMYGRHHEHMMNIELARILQHDREREIEQELRLRRLLRPTETTESIREEARPVGRLQRPASGAPACR